MIHIIYSDWAAMANACGKSQQPLFPLIKRAQVDGQGRVIGAGVKDRLPYNSGQVLHCQSHI